MGQDSLATFEADTPQEPATFEPNVHEPQKAKQFVAGAGDMVLGLPGLAGFVGSGLETVYNKAKGSDLDWKDEFVKSASEGVDRTLSDASNSATEWMEGLLGIGKPQTQGEAISRFAGSMLPVPTGMATSALGKAVQFLTPALKVTTPLATAGRLAGQTAAGAGINIGVDSLLSSAFGDQGQATLLRDAQPASFESEPASFEAQPADFVSEDPKQMALDTANARGSQDAVDRMVDIDKAMMKEEYWDTAKLVSGLALAALTTGGLAAWRVRARTLAAQAGQAPVGRPQSGNAVDEAIEGFAAAQSTRDVIAQAKILKREAGVNLVGNHVDSFKFVEDALRKVGVNQGQTTEFLDAAKSTATDDMAKAVLERDYGALPSGSTFTPTADIGIAEIDRRLKSLSPETQAKWVFAKAAENEFAQANWNTLGDAVEQATQKNTALPAHGRWASGSDLYNDPTASADDVVDYVATHQHYIDQVRGSSDPVAANLWKNSQKGGYKVGPQEPVTWQEMRQSSQWLNSEPELKHLSEQYGKNMTDIANYLVERGEFSRREMDQWLNRVTVRGNSTYVPGMTATESRGWTARLASFFGLGTTQGRELAEMDNFLARATKHGEGIKAPEGAIAAADTYVTNMMRHLNTNGMQRKALFPLTGLHLHANGDPDLSSLRTIRAGEKTPTRFIGMHDPQDGSLIINEADDEIKKLYLKDGKDSVRKVLSNDNTQWVKLNGKEYGFHVPDRGLRVALEINPASIPNAAKTLNAFKKIYTTLTTGAGSLRAVAVGGYAAQQAAMNRGLMALGKGANPHAALKEGFSAYPDTIKGAKEHIVFEASRLFANALRQGLDTDTGISSLVPGVARYLVPRLERAYQQSILRALRREGAVITGAGSNSSASDFGGHVSGVLSQINPTLSRTMGVGALQVIGRTWMIINRAAREGAATGTTLRELKRLGGSIDPESARLAMLHSKEVVGDVRRRGASESAMWMAASVPYYGATIQSWASIGRAIAKAPEWAIPAMITTVGLPLVAATAYNEWIAQQFGDMKFTDAKGYEWTYKDYLHNGITDTQKANFETFFIPGAAPWDAEVIPLAPEYALFRSMVFEGLDAMFNLSDVGIAGETGLNGNVFWKSLGRAGGFSPPPLVGAAMAGLGMNVQVAPSLSGAPGEGEQFSMVDAHPLVSGQRVDANSGQERYVNSYMDTKMQAVLNALFGSAASAYIAIAETMHTSQNDPTPMSQLERWSHTAGDAAEQFGIEAGRQAPWTPSLWNKSLRTSNDHEVNSKVIDKVATLRKVNKDFGVLFGGGHVTLDGKPIAGDSVIPPQDPVYQEFVSGSRYALMQIDKLGQQISEYKRQISTLGTSTHDPLDETQGKKRFSPRSRQDVLEALNTKINLVYAQQYKLIEAQEAVMQDWLHNRYGRDFKVDFSHIKPRPNL